MPDITYDVGRVSFVMKGAWNLATNYEKLDAVSYNGSLYIAKQDVPGGTAITNTTYWQLAAEKGDQGETGNGIASITLTGTAGNVDTYTITFTDGTTTTFTVTNGGVTTVNGRTGDVTGLAEEDGSYPLLNAGTADNLTPYSEDSGATQSIPFIAQGTGCGNGESVVDTGSYLQFNKKLGNTVAVNQLVDTATTSVTIPTGHKYYAVINGTASIGTSNGTAIAVTGGQDIIIDLTLWFGSNDRIPSDLLSHPENWGRYYAGSLAYAAGYLDSADGSILTSLPRNCFDGELESGSYDPSTGAKIPNANTVRSKNLIPCIPNETYYFRSATALPAQVFYVVFFDAQGNFVSANINGYYNATKTIPANAHFMGFWAGSASYPVTDTSRKFTISLYYSGESGYDSDHPYSVLAEVDTGSEVLRSAGAVADEKTPDGTITRRISSPVDLSTLAWSENTTGQWYATLPITSKNNTPNIRADKYIGSASGAYDNSPGFITIQGLGGTRVWVTSPTSPTGNAIFELATPTTEQGTAFAENIPCDDFGSLMWTQTKGIPQGNEIFYPVDYKASIDTLYNRVGGDMSKIVTEDEYPEAPSSDGTYVLKATVSGGTKTYAWVAE